MTARALLVLSVVAAVCGCGRSGPLTTGDVRITIDSNAAAGIVEARIGGALAATCPGECSVVVPRDAELVLTALGVAGELGAWGGDAASCGSSATCVLQPSRNGTVSAVWRARLTVSPSPPGVGRVVSTPAGIDCVDACSGTFPFGSAVTLDAVADPGFFRSWGGACSSITDLSCPIVADGAIAVDANFSLVDVTLAAALLDQFATAVVADPQIPGGYFLAGAFDGAFSFGSVAIAHSGGGGREGFYLRVLPGGTTTWSATIPALGDVRPHAIDAAIDTTLAVFVGGSFTGVADIDRNGTGADPVGDINSFLLRHNVGSAAPAWADEGLGAATTSRSILADLKIRGSRLGITGTESGAVSFGGSTLDSGNQNRHHAFTATWGLDGSLQRIVAHGKGGGSHAEGRGITFTEGGDPVTASFYEIQDDVGPCDPGADAGTRDGFVFSLDVDDFSSCDWSRRYDIGGDDRLSDIVAASGIRLVTVGARLDSGNRQVVIREVDGNDGSLGWTTVLPTTEVPLPFGIAYDADRGEVVIAGSFAGTITVDGVEYVSAGDYDVLVVRLDEADGSIVSVATAGGTGADVVGGPDVDIADAFTAEDQGYAAGAVAILASSQVAIAGWTTSPAFEGQPTGGGADLFVLRVAPFP